MNLKLVTLAWIYAIVQHRLQLISIQQTFWPRSRLVHSSGLGKKSPYNCQKLPSTSNANRRRQADLRSQSVCYERSEIEIEIMLQLALTKNVKINGAKWLGKT